ncbi:unnamed protein product [Calypogeia fissa]
MVTAGVSNLGLDSVGMLLSIPKWSPICGLGRRGSSRPVGSFGGIGSRSRGERSVAGSPSGQPLKGRLRFVQRWRSRREILDDVKFRATAADDVEQKEKEVGVEKTEDEKADSSSERENQLSSEEKQQEQQQLTNGGKVLGPWTRSPKILSTIVKEWTSFTAVREKGDVRDVVLMSLSFAVLIYISQHLVHAYCTLRQRDSWRFHGFFLGTSMQLFSTPIPLLARALRVVYFIVAMPQKVNFLDCIL